MGGIIKITKIGTENICFELLKIYEYYRFNCILHKSTAAMHDRMTNKQTPMSQFT